ERAEQLESGVPRREEEAREERRENRVQVEIVPLEDRADRRRDDDAPFLRRVDAALDRSNRSCFHRTTHPSSRNLRARAAQRRHFSCLSRLEKSITRRDTTRRDECLSSGVEVRGPRAF